MNESVTIEIARDQREIVDDLWRMLNYPFFG